jgi:F-type H+-transporting ATPase subunit epsilon
MLMRLKILLPYGVFSDSAGVTRVVARGRDGSFGLLPHRLDCVAALAPGILTYEIGTGANVCAALDEGLLVKIGFDVTVSVRNAIGGASLDRLREAVERQFETLGGREKRVRTALATLESAFIRRITEFERE